MPKGKRQGKGGRGRKPRQGRRGASRYVGSPPPEPPVVQRQPDAAAAVESLPSWELLRTPSTAGGSIIEPEGGDVRAQVAQVIGLAPGVPVEDDTTQPAEGSSALMAWLVAAAVVLVARFFMGWGWLMAALVGLVVLVVIGWWTRRAEAGG